MPGYPHPDWQSSAAHPHDRGDQPGRVYGQSPAQQREPGGGSRSGDARVGAGAGAGAGGGSQRRAAARGAASADPRRRAGAAPGRETGRVRPGGAGRGRQAYPAIDEPAARRPRRRTPVWATLTVTVGAVLTMLSGVALAGGNFLVDRYTGNVQQENLLGDAASDPTEELEGPINMLLLGTDARGAESDDIRSDTIIVLHVPSSHDQAYLISVPRDTWVAVPGYWEMKITEAFYHGFQDGDGVHGGVQLLARTMNQLVGLSFNAAAIINFPGFERIIDAMGGIEYCVTDGATSEHFVMVDGERVGVGRARREGLWPQEPIRYEVGCQQMQGWQALDYVRQRKQLDSGEGDYGRQRNQQLLLQAMASQAASSDVRTNVAKLDELLLAAGDALIVDTNQVDMLTFLFTMRNIRPGDLISLRTNGGSFNSDTRSGQSVELLTAESMAMFEAAANDTMAQFVLNHPDFINSD
jgi:LCP family protein required for cell wall assembly